MKAQLQIDLLRKSIEITKKLMNGDHRGYSYDELQGHVDACNDAIELLQAFPVAINRLRTMTDPDGKEVRLRTEYPEQAINDLIDSIKRIGQYRPILVDKDNRIIDGYLRVEALKRMNRGTAMVKRVRDANVAAMLDSNAATLTMTPEEYAEMLKGLIRDRKQK